MVSLEDDKEDTEESKILNRTDLVRHDSGDVYRCDKEGPCAVFKKATNLKRVLNLFLSEPLEFLQPVTSHNDLIARQRKHKIWHQMKPIFPHLFQLRLSTLNNTVCPTERLSLKMLDAPEIDNELAVLQSPDWSCLEELVLPLQIQTPQLTTFFKGHEFPHLRRLSIPNTKATGEIVIPNLVTACPHLTQLDLIMVCDSPNQLDEEGMKCLATLPLTTLKIEGPLRRPNRAVWEHFRSLSKTMEKLTLSNGAFTNIALRYWLSRDIKFPRVKVLDMHDNPQFLSSNLQHLSSLFPSLITLDISGSNQWRYSNLGPLLSFKYLQHVTCDATHMTESDVKKF